MKFVFLNRLRALLMLLGLVLHACAAFSPSQYWLVSYPESVIWADSFNQVIHFFRMPTFFIISGFFATYLLQKRNLSEFIYNKTLRIGLPFISCLFFLNIAQYWLISDRINVPFFKVDGSPVGHLWFLRNLFIYFLVYGFLFLCSQYWLRRTVTNDLLDRKRSVWILIVFMLTPLIFLALLALNKLGIDIYYEVIILGSVFSIFEYFDYFLTGSIAGILIIGKQALSNKALLLSFTGAAALCICISIIQGELESHNQLKSIINVIQQRWLTLLASGFLIIISHKFLQINSALLDRIFVSSYTVYLFHHIFVVSLVLLLGHVVTTLNVNVSPVLAFFFVLFGSFTLSLLVHEHLIAKFHYLKLLFNGK